jgi:Divergent InlB B-repeat domain
VTRVAAALVVTVLVGAGALPASGAGNARAPRSVRSTTIADALPVVSGAQAATAWCGAESFSDRAPNPVAGNPVRWVYAIPADGSDNLAAVASVMQADAESIDDWWRGQDPTRVPRNDLASFSCGTQLDVTTLRISRSSAQLAPLEGRFSAIAEALQQSGLGSAYTKDLVYYDGPSAEESVCGQGGSDNSGFGAAVVYYRSCAGVSTAAVAAHEFLHTIGAVPRSAPNSCTDGSGHVCDTETDLMYPALGGEPLSSKILDPGRNDYYGHAGAWTDSRDSAWLVRLDAQARLALTVTGTGSVAADVPGLSCAATCTTTWNAGQQLALTATPAVGSKLVRWTGACTGSGGCLVDVGTGASVSALFAPATFRLTVAVTGRGSVRSSRSGISCRPRCSASFPSFTPVRLTATPARGWKLRAWSGVCRGARSTCTVPMSAASSARARFVRR